MSTKYKIRASEIQIIPELYRHWWRIASKIVLQFNTSDVWATFRKINAYNQRMYTYPNNKFVFGGYRISFEDFMSSDWWLVLVEISVAIES
jgi:hypothetical protein